MSSKAKSVPASKKRAAADSEEATNKSKKQKVATAAASSKKKKPVAASAASSKKKKSAAAAAPASSPLDPALKPSLRLQLSQFTHPELKKLFLEANEQSHFGLNKMQCIEKIQKLSKSGCIARCKQCKFGHLKPRKKGQAGSKYYCPGCQLHNNTHARYYWWIETRCSSTSISSLFVSLLASVRVCSDPGMKNFRDDTHDGWNACTATAEVLVKVPFRFPAGVKDYTAGAFRG